MINDKIDLVINTVSTAQSIADSFSIRRTALTRGIPHYTTVAGAQAVIQAIEAMKRDTLDVAPLQSYSQSLF